jgi:hypothetical protein
MLFRIHNRSQQHVSVWVYADFDANMYYDFKKIRMLHLIMGLGDFILDSSSVASVFIRGAI